MKRVSTLILALVMVFTMTTFPTTARAEDNLDIGTIQDHVYWNESMKIGCKLDEEWELHSCEEIQEEQLTDIRKNGGYFWDLYAVNMRTTSQIYVFFQRLTKQRSKTLMETRLEYDSFVGIDLKTAEITFQEIEFMGEMHKSALIVGQHPVLPMPIYGRFIEIESGNDIIFIAISTLKEEEVDELPSCFFNSLDGLE